MRIHRRSLLLPLLTAIPLLIAACGGTVPTATRQNATPTAITGATQAPSGTPTAVPTPVIPTPTATVAPTATAQPKRGGTLRMMHQAAANRVDPHSSRSTGGSYDVWNLIGVSVFQLDFINFKLEPGLAESYEWKSPTELIIKLKRNVHFQKESMAKGREVVADDLTMTLDRARLPNVTAGWSVSYRQVDKVETVDKYTTRVTFKRPDVNYLYYLTHSQAGVVLPAEAMQKYPKPDTLNTEETWYGAGPFVPDLSSYRADVSGGYNRNASYDAMPGGLPYLDRVDQVTIADPSSRRAAVQTGQVTLGLIPTLDADLFKKAGFQLYNTEWRITAGQYISMNTQLFPFNDARVRYAVHLATDRDELKQIIADGWGCINVIVGCHVGSGMLTELDPAIKNMPGLRLDKKADIEQAKALLKEAGVDPKAFTIKWASDAPGPYKTGYDTGLTVRTQLERNLGMKFDVTQGTAQPTIAQTKEKGYQMANHTQGGLGGHVLDWGFWIGYHTESVQNNSLWSDPKTDQLIEAQAAATDPVERGKIMREAQLYLLDPKTMPTSVTVRNFDYYAAAPYVRGWKGTNYFLNVYAWQFAWVWFDK